MQKATAKHIARQGAPTSSQSKVELHFTFSNDSHNNAKIISQQLRIVMELNWFSYPVALADFYYFFFWGGGHEV